MRNSTYNNANKGLKFLAKQDYQQSIVKAITLGERKLILLRVNRTTGKVNNRFAKQDVLNALHERNVHYAMKDGNIVIHAPAVKA